VLLKVLRAAAAPSANTAAVASGSGNGGGGGNGDSSNGEKGNGPRADSRAEFTALCLLRLVVLQVNAVTILSCVQLTHTRAVTVNI